MAVMKARRDEDVKRDSPAKMINVCCDVRLLCPANSRSTDGDDDDITPNEHEETQQLVNKRRNTTDEMIFWKAMADLTPSKNPSLLFDQVHQAFVGSYWSAGIVSSVAQYIRIYHWLAPHSRAMNASRDALCLLHLGTRYRDKNLVMEGRTRHLAALRCLGEEIQRPSAFTDDSVLGACYTMAQCEVYKVISQEGVGWIGHMPGLTAIFAKRGAKSIQSPFAQAVLHNTQQVAVVEGLLKRRRTTFASPSWITRGQRSSKAAVRLSSIALQISGALEAADRLCATKVHEESETEIVDLLTEMVKIEQQLLAWLLDFYKSIGGDIVPYKEVNVSAFPGFKEKCGGLAHVFPKVFAFHSILVATSHTYVWTCLLPLRQAIADVARLHPFPLVRPVNQDATLTAAVDETAANLCKTVPYLSHTERSFAGILACGAPLFFAMAWYKQRQDVLRSVWCGTVRDFLQRDVLTGGTYETSINLQQPLLTWWMLPDIFESERSSAKV